MFPEHFGGFREDAAHDQEFLSPPTQTEVIDEL